MKCAKRKGVWKLSEASTQVSNTTRMLWFNTEKVQSDFRHNLFIYTEPETASFLNLKQQWKSVTEAFASFSPTGSVFKGEMTEKM